ncbi:MAG: phosphoribosylanthranilate isomerase [Fimbriimonadaceae bacterium]|nr:phosphoribosylanthranilate isomerase [Fimbriimonadaceae bacterium]QYK58775.1 MAG: phosphoribosylanthranilate isomerase [Fimbriimonadaceae bacterium]
MTRVKICGLTRIIDVEAAIDLGAHAVGFVMEPSSPRCVAGDERLMEAVRILGPYVVRVSVFGEYQPGSPEFDRVQSWSPLFLSRDDAVTVVRPGLGLEEQLSMMTSHSHQVRAVVVDGYSPGQAGGTGLRPPDDFVERVATAGPWKLVLAGGLTPDNVAERVRRHRPYAVDVSSGVESSPGVKDPAMMRDFIAAVVAG